MPVQRQDLALTIWINSGLYRRELGRLRRTLNWVPGTQSLLNRPLASDPPRQFCHQMSLISSDNIVQKGLAFGRHWSGTVR